jgi:chitin disaccharide deacetylase
MKNGVILNADDYAMTRGISDGILALAEAGRLSATSAIVTTDHWRSDAAAAIKLRGRFAVGLHLNLTFGKPLRSMPSLAPDGVLPSPDVLIGRAVSRRIDRREVGAEIDRQLDRFEEMAGVAPDFVDGHHHAHVLPGIRNELIAALKRRFPDGGPLVRVPSDTATAILRRRVAAGKGLSVALLSLGLRPLVEANRFVANAGFSGFSTFGNVPYAKEFEAFLLALGPRPMIMCHPGLPDDELGESDTIRNRRPEEQQVIANRGDIPSLIWRPDRATSTTGFPW